MFWSQVEWTRSYFHISNEPHHFCKRTNFHVIIIQYPCTQDILQTCMCTSNFTMFTRQQHTLEYMVAYALRVLCTWSYSCCWAKESPSYWTYLENALYARQMTCRNTQNNCTICAGRIACASHNHTGSLRDIGFLAVRVSYTYNNNNIVKMKSTQARCARFVRITCISVNRYMYLWRFFFASVWCSWGETLRWWTIHRPSRASTIFYAMLSLSDGVNFSKPFSFAARFSVLQFSFGHLVDIIPKKIHLEIFLTQ